MLAYLFCSLPPATAAPPAWLWNALLLLCVSTPPLLWLAARALFRDRFAFTLPVLAVLPAFALLAMSAHSAGQPALRVAHGSAALLCVAAAVWEIGRDRQGDLVEPRRAVRRWAVLGIAAYVALVLAVEMALPPQGPEGRLLPVLHVAGIGVAALSLALVTARHSLGELLGPADATLPVAVAPEPSMPAGERRLLERLTQAMNGERLYRREGLTLAALASHLGCGEAALRALVNQRLGHRNFNDFLHRYRIDEAAARLVVEDLPVLTIALECGYGSIGPFNRAFKQRIGMTPTEYRAGARLASGRAPARPSDVPDALRATK